MKKVYKRSLTSKLYFIFGLCWVWMSMSSCLYEYYSPSSDASFSGTTTYCQYYGATPITYTYNQCLSPTGIFTSGVTATAQWYYNTTGGTSIATSTALGMPVAFTTPFAATGTTTFTPLTSTPGTFYYFAYISWIETGTCTIDYTTGTEMIVVNPVTSGIIGTSSACVGSTSALIGGPPGGTWSSSVPANASVSPGGGVVTGVAAGTSIISYFPAPGGCASLDTFKTLVTPVAITPTVAVTICQLNATTYSCTPTGGTWSSSNTSIAAVGSSSGIVSGLTGGTATITYTLSTGCYATKSISVNGLVGPIHGSHIACPGFTNVLTDTGTGGVWSSSLPAVASIDPVTGLVTGATLGTTMISYVGCGSAGFVVTVHPNPGPITGPGYVCAGGATISVYDDTLGGTWSSNIPGLASATTAGSGTGIITGLIAGNPTITYESPLSCYAVRTITVNPLPAPIGGIVPVCAGQTMTLTDAISGGSWSSSVPGVATIDALTGLVTGITGGSTTISYTNACGTGTAIVDISLLATPITGRDSVCIGSYTTLANVTTGGTWSSSNPAVAYVVAGGGSGLYTGLAEGTTVVSYTLPGGCFALDTITSFLLPSAISGGTQVCQGSAITLANSITGGTWTSANAGAATVGLTSGVVTGIAADTAGMVYTTPSGCTAYTLLTVNPLPAPIISYSHYCPYVTDTLADISAGGTWTSLSPGVATINATSGIMTTVSGGTANIKYTLPTGCSITKSFAVSPLPPPTVHFDAFINTFYTDTIYSSYQWYDSAQGLIPGAVTYRTAGVLNGNYWVVVTDSTGCTATSAFYHYNVAMGVGNMTPGAKMNIYPNPATETVYIDAPMTVRAIISSADGKTLIDKQNAKTIDISRLANGVYFIAVYDENGVKLQVQKLIKE